MMKTHGIFKRTHTMLPQSLWSEEQRTNSDKVVTTPRPYTEFKVKTTDNIKDKFSLMDISAEIEMSFLGGLISVGGSAKYLDERKNSHKSTSVTFKSHRISHSEVSDPENRVIL